MKKFPRLRVETQKRAEITSSKDLKMLSIHKFEGLEDRSGLSEEELTQNGSYADGRYKR